MRIRLHRQNRWRIRLAFCLAMATLPAAAQDTTPVMHYPNLPPGIDEPLVRNVSGVPHLVINFRGPGPVTFDIPAGTPLAPDGDGAGGGTQRMMTVADVSVMIRGDAATPVRHAGLRRPPIQLAALSSQAGSASEQSVRSIDVPLPVVCIEENKPDPVENSRWRLLTPQQADQLGLAHLRDEIRQLGDGIVRVDREVEALAAKVHAIHQDRDWQVVYDGDPLSEADAQLFRIVDWTVAADGTVSGRLNRSVVVQFAAWALSDGATRSQFVARLSQPRFADLQPRARSLRWGIEHLLTAAGFSAGRFDHDVTDEQRDAEKPGR